MAKNKGKEAADNSAVRKSKHFREIKDCLESGWPAPTIHEYLLKRYGKADVPSEKSMTRWRAKHLQVEAAIIPKSIIFDRLKGTNYKIDVMRHQSQLVAICEYRVARGMENEEVDGSLLKRTDGAIRLYLESMAAYIKVAQDLGIIQAPPQPLPPYFDFSSKTVVVTPGVVDRLQETVREIERLRLASSQDRPPEEEST
jgi:hypothetical protein